MFKQLLALMLLWPCGLLAEEEPISMVYSHGEVTIHLLTASCEAPGLIAAVVAQGAVTVPKTAAISVGNDAVSACWALDRDTDVVIGDEVGDAGYVPAVFFRPASQSARPQCSTCI